MRLRQPTRATPNRRAPAAGPPRPGWLAGLAALAAVLAADSAGALCGPESVLTLIGTDTRSEQSLFAVSGDGGGSSLLVIDVAGERARGFPDALVGTRRGASHGPGPFLAARTCGAGCLQPVRFDAGAWSPLGPRVERSEDATLHFTYEASGAPWMLRQRLTEQDGVSEVEAFRFDGHAWVERGVLRVRGIGAPAAAPDPRRPDAVLVGTGRFAANAAPAYWLPAIPRTAAGSRGQVVGLAGAAAYLSFDSHLFFSSDGGVTWYPEQWTPWTPRPARQPLWTPGVDFWLDLPAASRQDGLAVLWYDERRDASPAVYLARWSERSGWQRPHHIPLAGPNAPSIDQALATASGKWLLLGPCRGSVLDALVVEPGSGAMRRPPIAIEPAGGG